MSYIWDGSSPLRRSARTGDTFVEVGEVFDPTENELRSFGDLMVEVPDPDSGEDDLDSDPQGESGEDGDAEPESDSEEADDSDGSEPDYESMDYSELRQLAVDADTDEIDGRSKKAEIIEYFS